MNAESIAQSCQSLVSPFLKGGEWHAAIVLVPI